MSDTFSPAPPDHKPDEPETATPPMSAAVMKFKSCRWRRPPEDGPECCGHRDVLPMAGTTGFNPDAWCEDCAYYKARRVTRKKEEEPPHDDYRW